MHSVIRSPEPTNLFDELRCKYNQDMTPWDKKQFGPDRWKIRRALEFDFGKVCAYCEQPCQEGSVEDAETTDHFEPRVEFPKKWLDWNNMVLACRRCNRNKGGKWPGRKRSWPEKTGVRPAYDDAVIDARLIALHKDRYVPPSEYANPSVVSGKRFAQDLFSYNFDTGEIWPSESLDNEEWSIARRTIVDIDLNDIESGQYSLGEYDENNLWEQRLDWLDWVLGELMDLDDIDSQRKRAGDFIVPKMPYSGFISAYFESIPDLSQLNLPPLEKGSFPI